ncbi:hypothetical protein LP420_27090 [Massilia sp. B-10]|nr:hypothetical protein LP420_27090 [Massilia sp. B-10]
MRFSRPDGGLAFFGPDWYLLRPGNGVCAWPSAVIGQRAPGAGRFRPGAGRTAVRRSTHLEGEFFLDSGAAHFEVRAFAQALAP